MNANASANHQINRSWWGYAVILLVAAGLRFALLGVNPLDDQQANLALQALSVSRNVNRGTSLLHLSYLIYLKHPVFGLDSGRLCLAPAPSCFHSFTVNGWAAQPR